MSVRNLEKLFRPSSVALIGASPQPGSVGAVVLRNLRAAGFSGPIMAVNPRHETIDGLDCHPSIAALPESPDLAVICTPPDTVPGLVSELGQRETRAAVVLTAGLGGSGASSLRQAMLDAARPRFLRVLGPNCLGLMVPGLGLNATFAHAMALPGNLAFVSQSGALCTAVLDRALASGIGFSHFVSLGDSADVDIGDVLDYLGADPSTRAILFYIESVTAARKFMSAARAAARNKPVIAIKAGRVAAGARAAASHTGALAGSDDVYDAAIRRSGILRVYGIGELFDAVETLARAKPVRGDRLAIVTNGGGLGVMAVDELVSKGGTAAELDDDTVSRLDAVLPGTWSRGNPIDVIGDAPPERYARALEVLLDAPGNDAVLALYAPTATAGSSETARAVVDAAEGTRRCLLTSWVGGAAVSEARTTFATATLPTYGTPGQAVRAFLHLVEYRRNQEMLTETPSSRPIEFDPRTAEARSLIETAVKDGREELSEPEAKALIGAYGVPTVETHVVDGVEAAVRKAREIGFPVALKIFSPDISHKSDVGGVALDLETPQVVADVGAAMLDRASRLRPGVRVRGFTVQPMARRPGAFELIIGIATDPVFGPVILFGQGGTAVEIVDDQALALPPLNMVLARELISRTRTASLLEGYRDRSGADMDALCTTLMMLAQMTVDLPELVELDINPLLADEAGVLALDARARLTPASEAASDRLAIRPYPSELEETCRLPDGRAVTLRPIRPEDEPAHQEFFSRLAPGDVYFRFFGFVRHLAHSEMARYTQIDYDREMAFVATAAVEDGQEETLGVARIVCDPDNVQGEFAIIVRSDLKGQGLGHVLTEKLIRYCRARGTTELVGQVLRDNIPMLKLAQSMGFRRSSSPSGGGAIEIRLDLAASD
jgi:acetyltransferase